MELNSPKLNMAIPSPASESMEMEFAIMVGMEMWNLHQHCTLQNTAVQYKQ